MLLREAHGYFLQLKILVLIIEFISRRHRSSLHPTSMPSRQRQYLLNLHPDRPGWLMNWVMSNEGAILTLPSPVSSRLSFPCLIFEYPSSYSISEAGRAFQVSRFRDPVLRGISCQMNNLKETGTCVYGHWHLFCQATSFCRYDKYIALRHLLPNGPALPGISAQIALKNEINAFKAGIGKIILAVNSWVKMHQYGLIGYLPCII